MFTGIIDHCGKLLTTQQKEHSRILAIQSSFKDLKKGESIAVNGVCLTVFNFDEHAFYCELSSETLNKTNMADIKVGASVNLELPLRA